MTPVGIATTSVIPLILLLTGLGFTVITDTYIPKKHKRTMLLIDENDRVVPEDEICLSVRDIISGHHKDILEGVRQDRARRRTAYKSRFLCKRGAEYALRRM